MSADQQELFSVELLGIWNLFQYVIVAKASLFWPIVLQHWWRIQFVRWCTLLHLVAGYNQHMDPSASVYSITLQDPCMCQIYKSVWHLRSSWWWMKTTIFWYFGRHLTFTCFFAEHSTSDMSANSLPLLFLIPAALILAPGISWVCCYWKQRRRRYCPPPHCQGDAVINIRGEHHNNNPAHQQQRGTDSGFRNTSVSTARRGSNERNSYSSHVQYV